MAERPMMAWELGGTGGVALARCGFDGSGLSADGVSFHSGEEPHTAVFRLECGPLYRTRRMRIAVLGSGWDREVELTRSDSHGWSSRVRTGRGPLRAAPLPDLEGAVDCDLWMSPLTNIMPVRRAALMDRDRRPTQSLSHAMAWIDLPGLTVECSRQDYSLVRPRGDEPALVRLEDRDSDFRADFSVDEKGFVIHYPEIATRVDDPGRVEELVGEVPGEFGALLRAKRDELLAGVPWRRWGDLG
ncbi:putative glycolipid-binding domain-containing protein [Nocardiopsis dassonvillei]|uniref:putative glycolipid-binding domain-containing protein n=1 Tax=Nocardiopsis dassonvillei TaxID=2014 RepID=UPI0020A30355|nr:putative glycolipid-binding domain-containing protein [Nocardiopsis dassonvillei]MCP3016384.1 putative glycolipid-binding domain-containing protein [Nocardiopsis dassonvillei]